MKNVKVKTIISTLSIIISLVACSKDIISTAPSQTIAVQPTTVAPLPVAPVSPAPAVPVTPTVPQAPQRTVIENGEVKVWAETFNRDETIKPIKYEVVEGLSVPGHSIFYEVDGHVIEVAVNEKSGDRYFYKDGSSVNFARIGSDVKSSNENILLQVNINKMLNEEIKKKYK